MRANLSIANIDGLVSAHEFRNQISHCESFVAYFICHEHSRYVNHAVLNALIKEPGRRARIIFMDSGNIPLIYYPQAKRQIEYISNLL